MVRSERERARSRCKEQSEAAEQSEHPGICSHNQSVALPSKLPDEFWLSEELQLAISARDFGQLLRAFRRTHSPELTQVFIAEVLGLTQSQVSRIERGVTSVRDVGKLTRWAQALTLPERYAWFRYDLASMPERDSASANEITESKQVTEKETLSETEGGQLHQKALPRTTRFSAAILDISIANGNEAYIQRGLEERQPLNIEFMRDATESFRRLDNRYGGGYSRAMVRLYITTEIEPKLRSGRYSNAIRRKLFTAVAELHQLAGWMAYDVGDISEGRSHLRQALSICQDIRNDAFAAELMAAMSHHAAFQKSADAALDLALAAKQAAGRAGLPALRAEAAVLEANGLALQGDARECIKALQRAEREFMAVKVDDSPPWLRYFDEAYLSAKFARTLSDLKRPADAERFARRSLEMSDGYERGRLFNTALLVSRN